MRKRRRRDVEPAEVRRYLRQELLRKVGHSDWSGPRLYRYDLAEELEPTPSVRSVVVVPSDSDQPEAVALPDHGLVSVALGPDRRVVSVNLVSSPATSAPRTPGRDIQLPREMKESPRSLEG